MMTRTISLWAATGATAMTLATGLAIGALAQVDADAAGLPVVQLERVEVVGSRAPAAHDAIAVDNSRSRRGTL